MRGKVFWFAVSAVVLFAFGNLFLTPYLHQREVTRVVASILDGWETGAIPETFQYWEDPNSAPPAYSLVSYRINKKVFDKEDDRRTLKYS